MYSNWTGCVHKIVTTPLQNATVACSNNMVLHCSCCGLVAVQDQGQCKLSFAVKLRPKAIVGIFLIIAATSAYMSFVAFVTFHGQQQSAVLRKIRDGGVDIRQKIMMIVECQPVSELNRRK